VSILYGTYTARVGVLCSTLLPNLRVPTSSYMMSPNATLRKHSIATIGADGIGPEVIDAGVQVLRKLAELDGTFALDFKDYDWSSETYRKTGKYIPDGGLQQLKRHDAILFGAVGAPGMLVQSSLLILLANHGHQTYPIIYHSGICV
jgi:isocitrate dehydrogenase